MRSSCSRRARSRSLRSRRSCRSRSLVAESEYFFWVVVAPLLVVVVDEDVVVVVVALVPVVLAGVMERL